MAGSMQGDPGLQGKAFPMIRVAPRPSKPRQSGLTILADRGMGLNRLTDILDTAADYIDWGKMGIGAWRLLDEALLRRKIELYHGRGIGVFLAGDASEAAFLQGVSRDFYRAVKALGADGVEVSSAQVTMSVEDKCALIALARDAGLQVVAEAGQKGNERWTRSSSFIHSQIEAYRRAGAWKVLVQAEGVSEGVESRKDDLILGTLARFDLKDLIFQAKDEATQLWYVTTLGNGVNLDVDDHQVLDLELMRRGIRKRGSFGLVGALSAEA